MRVKVPAAASSFSTSAVFVGLNQGWPCMQHAFTHGQPANATTNGAFCLNAGNGTSESYTISSFAGAFDFPSISKTCTCFAPRQASSNRQNVSKRHSSAF
eukprot:SAG11_NODE_39_length_21630_cov_11.188658_16_plen_100_part_00